MDNVLFTCTEYDEQPAAGEKNFTIANVKIEQKQRFWEFSRFEILLKTLFLAPFQIQFPKIFGRRPKNFVAPFALKRPKMRDFVDFLVVFQRVKTLKSVVFVVF